MPANFPEVWLSRVQQNLTTADEAPWLDGIAELDADVQEFGAGSASETNTIHIPTSTFEPDVLINNSTYPIALQAYSDSEVTINLDKYQTKVSTLSDDQVIGASYSRIDVVTGSHTKSINKKKYAKAIHALCPSADGANTPMVVTSGSAIGSTGTRKRIQYSDLVALKDKFDKMEVPAEGRRLVLCGDHYNDLLLDRQNFGDQLINYRQGKVAPVIAGFEIYSYVSNPYVTASTGAKKAFASVPTLVVSTNSVFTYQTYYSYGAYGTVYTRTYYSGAWYAWKRVWTDADFTSTAITNWNSAYGWGNHASAGYALATALNFYLPLAGGRVTGNTGIGVAESINQAVIIAPLATNRRALVIQGLSGQSANLQEWQNVGGSVLAYVTPTGNASFASAAYSTGGYDLVVRNQTSSVYEKISVATMLATSTILNQTSQQSSANFNIDGFGKMASAYITTSAAYSTGGFNIIGRNATSSKLEELSSANVKSVVGIDDGKFTTSITSEVACSSTAAVTSILYTVNGNYVTGYCRFTTNPDVGANSFEFTLPIASEATTPLLIGVGASTEADITGVTLHDNGSATAATVQFESAGSLSGAIITVSFRYALS